jgi:hypothetical protein
MFVAFPLINSAFIIWNWYENYLSHREGAIEFRNIRTFGIEVIPFSAYVIIKLSLVSFFTKSSLIKNSADYIKEGRNPVGGV